MKSNNYKVFLLGMFVLFAFQSFGQIQVSGMVKDNTDELLPGVSIQVKGTTRGEVTDLDGEYSLTVPSGQSVLIFSYIGMETQEVNVDGRTVVNVVLNPGAIGLDELVVTALGMKKEARALGYNISSVKAEDMETGGTGNVLKSLEGKVTGVQMNSLTSSPTSSVMFNIRGATSLAGIMQGRETVELFK